MDTSVCLRPATDADAASIAALLGKTFYSQGLWSYCVPFVQLAIYTDLFLRMQTSSDDTYQCWVAETTARPAAPWFMPRRSIVGTIEIALKSCPWGSQALTVPWQSPMGRTPQIPVAYISNLAVEPPYRHQGIGQALLHQCERQTRQWNHSVVYLHVKSENYSALSLYRKLGYREPSAITLGDTLPPQRTLLAKQVKSKTGETDCQVSV